VLNFLSDRLRGSALWAMQHRLRAPYRIREWERKGRPVPPPNVLKQQVLREYARRYGVRVFIETGTLLGEMDFVLKDQFARMVTIELSPEFHARAVRRLGRFRHIECLRGDSGALLPSVLAGITEPCLLWLDAHYSAGKTAKGDLETPISVELDAVLRHPVRGHVVLIDDARLFDGTHDYPPLNNLEHRVREVRPDLKFEVLDDSIRITPPRN
jgi:hypothetical protein